MNPNACQSSINCAFNGSTPNCHGFTLPRSFRPPSHRIRACKPFYGLLMAHREPNTPFHEKREYGPFWGLSWGILRRSSLSLFSLSSVWGNSRATSGCSVWGSQTRSCKACGFAGWFCDGFFFFFWKGVGTRCETADFREVTPYLIL